MFVIHRNYLIEKKDLDELRMLPQERDVWKDFSNIIYVPKMSKKTFLQIEKTQKRKYKTKVSYLYLNNKKLNHYFSVLKPVNG